MNFETLMKELPNSIIVGGAVRDLVMQKGVTKAGEISFANNFTELLKDINIKDVDIATSATPIEIIKKFYPDAYESGEAFGTISVKTSDYGWIEVTTFRKDMGAGRHPIVEFTDNFHEDSKRRDYSFNGMGIRFGINGKLELVDYHNGLDDLNKGIVKAIGNPYERIIYEEGGDPLRALRGIRFSNRYNFTIDRKTKRAIRKVDLKEVSYERMFDELNKIFGDNAFEGLKMLHKYGLIKKVIPELEKLNYVLHNPIHHPEGNPFKHTLVCVSKLNDPQFIEIIKNLCNKYNLDFKKVMKIAIWCVLLHDIGKDKYNPAPFMFHGHERRGEFISEKIMERFNTSRENINAVKFCAANHMKMIRLNEMKPAKQRILFTDPNFIYLLITHIADVSARMDGIVDISTIMEIIDKKDEIGRVLPKLVNGYDVMNCGFKGVDIGKILSAIEEKQVTYEITTKEEAITFIEQYNKIC